MASIMVSGRSLPDVAGQPLVDADGEILGILDQSGAAAGPGVARPYLPAPLVVGVAKELAMTGKVRHGWLGLQGQDASATGPTTVSDIPQTTTTYTTSAVSAEPPVQGAQVVAVDPGGPAAGALQPGDVIVALDGQPVRSMAELRARLYVLQPGTRATVTVERSGKSVTAVVELSPSP